MIYIQDISVPADIRIPRTLEGMPEAATLTLTGTTDRRTYTVPVEAFAVEGAYYAIRADFSAVNSPGEYEYRLKAEGANLAAGIAILGCIPAADAVQYEKAVTYEQYHQ